MKRIMMISMLAVLTASWLSANTGLKPTIKVEMQKRPHLYYLCLMTSCRW